MPHAIADFITDTPDRYISTAFDTCIDLDPIRSMWNPSLKKRANKQD
jgi:hypothetical protein